MASLVKLVNSSSNCSSVTGVTALLPEELDHPVRDLDSGLPGGNVHLGKRLRVGDVPPLHDPGLAVGAIHGGGTCRIGIRVFADERQAHRGLLISFGNRALRASLLVTGQVKQFWLATFRNIMAS